MSEYSDQRDAIATIVRTVTDVGVVQERPRFGEFHDHYLTQIAGVDQVRAWEIGIDEPGIEADGQSASHVHRRRYWAIRGYVSLIDLEEGTDQGSYDTLLDLCEAIQEALDANETLNNTCLHHDAVDIDEPLPITIGGGILCWATTLRFMAYTVA